MCFQPSPSSPIHKIPISRRAEVRSLSFSPPLLLSLQHPSSSLPFAYAQSPSFSVIRTPTITQTITQISGLPACLCCHVPSCWGRKKKDKKKKKILQAERIKSSVSDKDTVILRNNMSENGKSSKTRCHSQLSRMRGWRQSLSAAPLLQSLLRASAPAAPRCLFNL